MASTWWCSSQKGKAKSIVAVKGESDLIVEATIRLFVLFLPFSKLVRTLRAQQALPFVPLLPVTLIVAPCDSRSYRHLAQCRHPFFRYYLYHVSASSTGLSQQCSAHSSCYLDTHTAGSHFASLHSESCTSRVDVSSEESLIHEAVLEDSPTVAYEPHELARQVLQLSRERTHFLFTPQVEENLGPTTAE